MARLSLSSVLLLLAACSKEVAPAEEAQNGAMARVRGLGSTAADERTLKVNGYKKEHVPMPKGGEKKIMEDDYYVKGSKGGDDYYYDDYYVKGGKGGDYDDDYYVKGGKGGGYDDYYVKGDDYYYDDYYYDDYYIKGKGGPVDGKGKGEPGPCYRRLSNGRLLKVGPCPPPPPPPPGKGGSIKGYDDYYYDDYYVKGGYDDYYYDDDYAVKGGKGGYDDYYYDDYYVKGYDDYHVKGDDYYYDDYYYDDYYVKGKGGPIDDDGKGKGGPGPCYRRLENGRLLKVGPCPPTPPPPGKGKGGSIKGYDDYYYDDYYVKGDDYWRQ